MNRVFWASGIEPAIDPDAAVGAVVAGLARDVTIEVGEIVRGSTVGRTSADGFVVVEMTPAASTMLVRGAVTRRVGLPAMHWFLPGWGSTRL